MLLSVEIRRKIENKKAEMKALRDKGDIEAAHKMIGELENLNKELEIQLKIEEDEKNQVINNQNTNPVVNDKVDENRAFNKALMSKAMTDAEKKYVNSKLVENKAGEPGVIGANEARGGYLLPETHETQIRELRRKRRALKELVNVKKVTTRTGKFNTEGENSLELLNFEELNSLSAKDLKFAQKAWAIKDYGLLIPVANQFMEDTDVNIVDFIGKEFTKAAVRTENKAIITEFKKLTAKTIKGLDDIITALNVDLDPAISENAKIITNQTSFNYLDTLKDKNGYPILEPCLADPSKKMLKGKVIEVFSDEELTAKTAGNLTFYVGDPEEYLTFYEKKGIEVATSAEAGFKEYATWLRVVERFDVGVFDTKALVLCEMAKPAA